jgi:hypothetical protein
MVQLLEINNNKFEKKFEFLEHNILEVNKKISSLSTNDE